ncbi:MAG: hypothetical protein GTO14_07855 [Anaerolineales bacterium]|nr:hypothetical protein [Anaerolineales bacterium]
MSKQLRQDVWAMGRCSGCGVCVAACSKGVLYWDEEQHPLLEEREKTLGLSQLKLRTCEVCERFCELCCPRLTELAPSTTLDTFAARSAGVTQSGEPNELIRSLLVAARSADLIDGVLMLDMDPWSLKPVARIATSVDEIVSSVGMQFLWAPVLSALNEAVFDYGLSKLAVVATPCVAEGARRLMQANHPRLRHYREALRVVIASFCTGIFMPNFVDELLERGMGIPRNRIYRIKTSITENTMTVSQWKGAEQVVPLTEVEGFTHRGCSRCTDFLGEQADIAIGNVGAKRGFSTLIVRTPTGEVFLHNAIRFGLVDVSDQVDEVALSAAQTQKDLRSRAQAFDEFQILMLDALSRPNLQAAVRKRFVALYGAPKGKIPARENCNVSCGGC